VKFGFDIVQDRPLVELREWWRACDAGGMDVIGLPDSPVVARELYVTATHCLDITENAEVMAAVSNPISRDISVTGASLATLAELAPGRVKYGIGSGDSALWGVGLKPARVAVLRDYIVALKTFLRGEEAEFGGRRFASAWATEPVDVPIYVAASGPKTLRMAAQVADGLILAMGFGPDNLAYVDTIVREACAEVGRDPDELDIWGHCSLGFAATVEDGMARNLGVNPGWMAMGSMEGKQIPNEFREPLQRLTSDFGDVDAEYTTQHRGERLVEKAKSLGIYEWLASRAPGLWGPPEHVASRLLEFDGNGLSNWIFYGGGSDYDRGEWIETFTSEVIPRTTRA